MNSLENKTLLCFGDSWTSGHEMNPACESEDIFHQEHVDYRSKGKWPDELGKISNAHAINLGIPGCSNDGILRQCIEYITLNYLHDDIPVNDIFVIVGWSSPCRKEVIVHDSDGIYYSTLWPNVANEHNYPSSMQELYEVHVKYFWSEQEIYNRHVHHNIHLQSFLKSHGIKFLMFDAFYEFPSTVYGDEEEEIKVSVNSYREVLKKLAKPFFGKSQASNYSTGYKIGNTSQLTNVFHNDTILWNVCIDEDTYYYKNDMSKTFNEFLGNKIHDSNYFYDYHPTNISHKLWANELFNYITGK